MCRTYEKYTHCKICGRLLEVDTKPEVAEITCIPGTPFVRECNGGLNGGKNERQRFYTDTCKNRNKLCLPENERQWKRTDLYVTHTYYYGPYQKSGSLEREGSTAPEEDMPPKKKQRQN